MPDARLTAFQRTLDPSRIYAKAAGPVLSSAVSRLRILSWNIGHGHDPERIADTIAAIAPDIACLQEVDWGCVRSGGRDVLRILAERTGMLGLFGIEFFELDDARRRHGLAGGGVTGNALLTRLRPSAALRIELPAALDWESDNVDPALPSRVRRQIRREPRLGRRCGTGLQLDWGAPLTVWSAHLEDKFGGIAGRFAQFRALAAATVPGACVIAGDLNTFDSPLARLLRPDGATRALGKPWFWREAEWWRTCLMPSEGFVDPFGSNDWTFRAGGLFRSKLDWIAARGCTVHAAGVGEQGPSDHRPIWADVEVRDASDVAEDRLGVGGGDGIRTHGTGLPCTTV